MILSISVFLTIRQGDLEVWYHPADLLGFGGFGGVVRVGGLVKGSMLG